jgi:hypothetical protein
MAPSVVAATDVTIAQNLPGCDPTEYCIKVDVYRTVARNNSLPTFFARLVGVNNQDVQATATARILSANATDCLKPWGVADKWDEWNEAAPGLEHQFDRGAFDPDWNGALPYTVLLSPTGEILYQEHGPIDALELKLVIVKSLKEDRFK